VSNDSAHPMQALLLNTATASVTTAWTTLSSALTGSTSVAELYNSTTVAMTLGIGGGSAPTYVIPMTIFPSGGNGRVGLLLDAGTKLFLRAAQATTASSGLVAINLHK
jgi:hypothetical protein